MSNIDKQALNQEKIEWLNKLADMEYCKSNPGHWLMSLKDTNMLAKLALRSVALLDELEAAEALNKHLELAIRKADGCSEALRRKTEAAEKRIAELEARTVKLPEYRNSPDMHTKQFYEAIGFNQGLDVFIEALRAAGIGKGE
ncbi:hypothetical protein M6B24_06150 [Enterobacter bugandensis]|nr:hypothetical protein [Enterobacter bugandensis]